MPDVFNGYSEDSLRFLAMLRENNETQWFNSHRDEYERYILAPSRLFVNALGDELKKQSPGLIAEPKVNRSLFRINRDTRFSNDKSPYKTHHAVWLWEGTGPRMECSGFYFHMDPERLIVGVGIYRFPKHVLDVYRERVGEKLHGAELASVCDTIRERGYSVEGKHYKRVPRGCDADYEYAVYLKFNGLYTGIESDIPDFLFSADLVAYCAGQFRNMLPMHQWLVGLTEIA